MRFQEGSQRSALPNSSSWKVESVEQGHVFGALLTELSKAFDCFLHNLLIAKFNTYDFDNKAVRFVYDYLTCLTYCNS